MMLRVYLIGGLAYLPFVILQIVMRVRAHRRAVAQRRCPCCFEHLKAPRIHPLFVAGATIFALMAIGAWPLVLPLDVVVMIAARRWHPPGD